MSTSAAFTFTNYQFQLQLPDLPRPVCQQLRRLSYHII